MTIREKLVSAARGWLGTPFHHEARIKGVGVDCLQLIIAVYVEAGLLPEDIDQHVYHYAHDAHLHNPTEEYIAALLNHGWHEVAEAEAGDVALYKIGRRFSHGVIVMGDGMGIHSYIKRGVCFVDLSLDAELQGREVKYFSKIEGE